jgi:hypothetical protein
MKRSTSENKVDDEIPERNAGMAIRAVVFDIGGKRSGRSRFWKH